MSTIRAYLEGHMDAATPLLVWFKTCENANWKSYADVRKDFPSADLVAEWPFSTSVEISIGWSLKSISSGLELRLNGSEPMPSTTG